MGSARANRRRMLRRGKPAQQASIPETRLSRTSGTITIVPKLKRNTSKDNLRGIYSMLIGLVVFIGVLALLQPSSFADFTGRFLVPQSGSTQTFATTIITIVLIVVLLFIYLNRGNLKELLKNILSSIAIFAGIFTVIQFSPDIEIVIIALTVTFGLMAMIWTVRAKYSLSEGSTLRNFISHFFYCLFFLLLFSIYDSAIAILNLTGPVIYGRYVLIAIAYTVFVSASYKILRLGREFGFEDQSKKIAALIQRKPKPVKKKSTPRKKKR